MSTMEVVRDSQGEVLWEEPYPFERLSSVGEIFVRDSKWYRVLQCNRVLSEELYLHIETVVKEIPEGGDEG